METTVYERFDLFRSAPFTIQRFSELITDPKKHYKLKEKYLFALEKAVYVVSTVEPTSPEDEAEVNGSAENEVGAGDNGVSYQELNSSFNITPTDTDTMSYYPTPATEGATMEVIAVTEDDKTELVTVPGPHSEELKVPSEDKEVILAVGDDTVEVVTVSEPQVVESTVAEDKEAIAPAENLEAEVATVPEPEPKELKLASEEKEAIVTVEDDKTEIVSIPQPRPEEIKVADAEKEVFTVHEEDKTEVVSVPDPHSEIKVAAEDKEEEKMDFESTAITLE